MENKTSQTDEPRPLNKHGVNGWVAVTERLPEKAGFYLVNIDETIASKYRGTVEIGECFKSVDTRAMFEILKFHDYVTHWMVLPEPPCR